MTIQTSIYQFLENLLDLTLNNKLTWSPATDNKLELIIDDLQLNYTITWTLDIANGWKMSDGWLNIKSKQVNITVYRHDYPELMLKFRDHFYTQHFSKSVPPARPVIEHFEELNKKISLQEFREKKLNQVLNNPN